MPQTWLCLIIGDAAEHSHSFGKGAKGARALVEVHTLSWKPCVRVRVRVRVRVCVCVRVRLRVHVCVRACLPAFACVRANSSGTKAALVVMSVLVFASRASLLLAVQSLCTPPRVQRCAYVVLALCTSVSCQATTVCAHAPL